MTAATAGVLVGLVGLLYAVAAALGAPVLAQEGAGGTAWWAVLQAALVLDPPVASAALARSWDTCAG